MRRIKFSVGEYYHIYNRGVDKRVIFKDKFDHLRFIALLYICNNKREVDIHSYLKKEGRSFFNIFNENRGDKLVSIGAYCLMPNHFHILICEKESGGISNFMKKVGTAYAMYFNNRYERSGILFEGRYKAKHITTDSYLKYLYSYIHLNPVKLIDSSWKENGIQKKKNAEKFLNEYQFSSYLAYANKNKLQKNILDKQAFPKYFHKSSDFKNAIKYWLEFKT